MLIILVQNLKYDSVTLQQVFEHNSRKWLVGEKYLLLYTKRRRSIYLVVTSFDARAGNALRYKAVLLVQ